MAYQHRNQNWIPKTKLGKEVMEGSIVTLGEIFESGRKISEPEIIDKLIPNLKNEVIFTGGSAGKGGGKKPTPTKRTTRMHRSGRRFTVSAMVVVGNEDGYFGIGKAHSKETREAIQKAIQIAKLNIIPVKRGCGSWECACKDNHSIPFMSQGKTGSVRVVLLPAPKGIGMTVNDEAKKIIRLTGIKDIWTKSYGNTKSRMNYTTAIYNAFKNMNKIKSLKAEKILVKKEVVEEINKEVKEEKIETTPVEKKEEVKTEKPVKKKEEVLSMSERKAKDKKELKKEVVKNE